MSRYRRVYASTLRQLRDHLGADHPLSALEQAEGAARLVDWFTRRWADRAPATFNRNRNRNLDALRSAIGYWRDQDWLRGRVYLLIHIVRYGESMARSSG